MSRLHMLIRMTLSRMQKIVTWLFSVVCLSLLRNFVLNVAVTHYRFAFDMVKWLILRGNQMLPF